MTQYLSLKKHILTLLKAELSPNLHYHGLHHTLEVYKNAIEISDAKKISRIDLTLLKVAVLFHDAGFIKTYDGHEAEACEMVRSFLPEYQFGERAIEQVCGMIMATKIPQHPKCYLEKVIADADLMYLGTDNFEKIGQTLYEEREIYFGHTSIARWNQIQIDFLSKHRYHTDYCIQKYEAKKLENLEWLKSQI